ncbi:MAG: MerR family transcriptional regulator [Rubrivivax sp.]
MHRPAPASDLSSRPDRVTALHTTALCRIAGVTRGQLRIYERDGLLEAPARTAAGYRTWPADTLARLAAIRQLKEVGFTLREIALLLAERDQGTMTASQLARLAREQLVAIDARIARLQVVREYVDAVAQGDRSVLDDPDCAFLVRFLAADAGAAPAAQAAQAAAPGPAPASAPAPAPGLATAPAAAPGSITPPTALRRRAQPVRG